MSAPTIHALRDDVLSLEMLVDLFTDTEDTRLASTKRKLRKARAALARAESRSLDEQYDALVMSDPTGRDA